MGKGSADKGWSPYEAGSADKGWSPYEAGSADKGWSPYEAGTSTADAGDARPAAAEAAAHRRSTEAPAYCGPAEASAHAPSAYGRSAEAAAHSASAYRAPPPAALSKSLVREQARQQQSSSNKPKLFHGRLLRAASLNTLSRAEIERDMNGSGSMSCDCRAGDGGQSASGWLTDPWMSRRTLRSPSVVLHPKMAFNCAIELAVSSCVSSVVALPLSLPKSDET
jgi:hypothetical protein